jgi:RNA polymerase sigma-70 factor (ECF subfamily)
MKWMIKESDAELVKRTLNSDDPAFADLVARYQGKVYALIISHIRNFADAQDLTQDAFLAAYMKLKTLRDPGSFGPWVRKIAVNQCRVHGILKKRNEQMQKGYEDVLVASTSEAERVPAQADLWLALSRIPDDQRLVLTLFHLEKQSYQEIADFLEVPRTTVQTRLRYARQALKKEMIHLMKNELQSNRLPEGFPEDTVKAARELTESLMKAIPSELMNVVRHPYSYVNRERSQTFRTFYDLLTPEQKEAILNNETGLHFRELTYEQQDYLKQAFYQMWMWEIAHLIIHPPFYISSMKECKLALEGGHADGGAMMTILKETRHDGFVGRDSVSLLFRLPF